MSWSSLASPLQNLESAPDEVGLAFPPRYLGTFLQLHACCSSTPGASWRGWNLGLRLCGEEPADSPTLSQPVALSVWAFPDSEGTTGLGWAGLGALLRARGPQASALRALSRFGAGPGLGINLWVPELPDLGLGLVLGVRVAGAAVCTIINLPLLAGSGGAAVSACGPSQGDWPKGGETRRVLSFSYSSHNTSCGTAQGLWFGWGRSKTF